MECIELDNKIKITDVHDLDLAQTLDCGQSFRWKPQDDGSFHGVAYGKSVTVSLDKTDMYIENATADDFKNIWYSYFDFSLDYGKIRKEISTIHPVLNEAAKYAPGIRILRQEPFEALCTFIISQHQSGTIYINGKITSENKVIITIRDKGCGIPDIKKAMEPLFTTAPEEDRAGLGFAVMQSFCDKVRVRSKPDSGTTVTLEKIIGSENDR